MYTFDGRVRFSEVDAGGRLSIEKLIDYFQDCSTFQSEDCGAGIGALRERGLAWIVVYWRVEIRRLPVLGERIRVATLPYKMRGAVGLRNFFMEDGAGEKLAVANSVWSIVETSAMRPVRIPDDVAGRFPLDEKLDMEYDSRKIRIPDLPGTAMPDVIVREYHLDTNRHMNNGQYARIAAGFLPPGARIGALRIEYRMQAVLGDRITPVVYRAAPGEGAAAKDSVYISLNAKDGKPYAVLEVVLRSKEPKDTEVSSE